MRIYVLFLLLIALVLAACKPKDLKFSVDDLPPGDVARGAELFTQSINGAPACANCHVLNGGRSTGPSFQGFGAVAGSRVDGQTAAEYTFMSILRPSKHIVRGFSNVMPSDFEDKLSRQDIADLIAYLLSL